MPPPVNTSNPDPDLFPRLHNQNSQMFHTSKLPRLSGDGDGDGDELQLLLPGLPDHLAELCLSPLPPSLLFSVCRRWRRLIYHPSYPPFLTLYALLSKNHKCPNSDDVEHGDDEPIGLYCFDPIAGAWSRLPPPPPDSLLRTVRINHPSFIARSLPVQSVAAGGHLVLLAASTDTLLPALPRPLAFHPPTRRWILGPPLNHPRRWCAAGSAEGTVYLASGVGSDYRTDVARSAERWDPNRRSDVGAGGGFWETLAPLADSRFSREAVETVAAGRKLCMVNVQGRGAKEGAVYNIERDRWEEMPPGMIAGWTGPVAAPAAVEEGPIYVVDEQSGEVRAYVWPEDRWAVVAQASESRRWPVAVAAGGGKVCVAVDGGGAIVVVDVVRPTREWTVGLPAGKIVIALHVLPRMSREEF